MAQTNQTTKKSNLPNILLEGLLQDWHQFNGDNGIIITSTIVIPAVDEYSNPTRLSVRSNVPLGQDGESVKVNCILRSRYWKNKEGVVNYDPQLWQSSN